MKMFVNNCINIICTIYYLSKTVLNCLVVVKISFWQYDLLLIFTKVLKIYAIIIFVNIQDLKLLFYIREPSSCCYSISFWEYWHSHSGNFCSLWSQASHYCTIDSVSVKKEKDCLVGYNRVDRRVLFDISRITYIQWKWLYIIFFSGETKKKRWKTFEKFPIFLTCFKTLYTSQERHGDFFDQLEEFVCTVYGAKVNNFNN